MDPPAKVEPSHGATVYVCCGGHVLFGSHVDARPCAMQIQWTPYSRKTIVRCQQTGTPVVVLYHNFWATTSHAELVAAAPFEDSETVRVLNQAKFVMMDPGRDFLKMTPAEYRSMREAIDELGVKLPVIAIYDARRGDALIGPIDGEGCNDRTQRVGRLLREYATRPTADCPGKAK